MRTMLVAILMATGIGLAGVTGANSAPIGGSNLLNTVEEASPVVQVQWHGWRSRFHSRRNCFWTHGWYSHRRYVCRHF